MTVNEKKAKVPKGISILSTSTFNPYDEQRPFYCSWYGFVFDKSDEPDIPTNSSTSKNLRLLNKEK